MSCLNKLASGLIVVFVFFLLAVIAQLCYVRWYRRRFCQRSSDEELDVSGEPNTTIPKELLYFLCWKNQSRIEPAGAPASTRSFDAPETTMTPDYSDLVKWQELYGSSRLLFTIKEEEKEDLESEKSSVEKEKKMKKMVSLKSCFEETEVELSPVTVTVTVDEDRETPFSTPCASPPYYTPSPSPPRELLYSNTAVNQSVLPEIDDTITSDISGENKGSFVSLELYD